MLYLLAALLPLVSGFVIDSETEAFKGTVSLEDGEDVDLPENKYMENFGLGGPYGGLSPVEIVRFELLDLIRTMTAHEEYPGDVYGALVRLGFHDSATYDKWRGTGGAHGCIAVWCGPNEQCEYNSPHHSGLQPYIDQLNYVYDSRGYNYFLSRADWIHFAAFLAVKLSSPQYSEELYFQFGRTDCPHQKPYFGNMPDSEEDSFDYYNSFFYGYDLTPRDMIALLGAHTIGRSEYRNSGYVGPWTYKPDVFDNEYYKILYDPKFHWKRVVLNNPQWGDRHFFTSGEESPIPYRTMLYTDMSMFWNIEDGHCEIGGYNTYGGDRRGGYRRDGYGYNRRDDYNHNYDYSRNFHYESAELESGHMRAVPECPKNEWWGLLELYANDNYAWMHDFNSAFQKIQELGMRHEYGKGLGHHSGQGYDGYGGYGQNNAQTWGSWGGEYSTWGSDGDHSNAHQDYNSDYNSHSNSNSGYNSDYNSNSGYNSDYNSNSGYNSDYNSNSGYNSDYNSNSGYNSDYNSNSGYNSDYNSNSGYDSVSSYGQGRNYYRSAKDIYGSADNGYSSSYGYGSSSGYNNYGYGSSSYGQNGYNSRHGSSSYGQNGYNSRHGSSSYGQNGYNNYQGYNNYYRSANYGQGYNLYRAQYSGYYPYGGQHSGY